jgi:hypothetical protein
MNALDVQRAAGAALKTLKRRGLPPDRLADAEPLKPALAIEALVAAMRARFALDEATARELFAPALGDWRDAVGSADPLLLPDNAADEPQLVPLPLPSWCAWLLDLGVLRPRGGPTLEGPRIVLRAWLSVERDQPECFPVVFAGRASATTAGVSAHLAVSPPYSSAGFRGPVQIRAAAHRKGRPVPLWLGAPAAPGSETAGRRGTTVTTWTLPDGAGLPRWLVLRALEGREPQALWDLHALWAARLSGAPEMERAESPAPAQGSLRLAVDLGSTSTVVVEEDSAVAGSVGGKLLSSGAAPSGFLRLAGDARTAHLHGCGEELQSAGGQLPTALCCGGPEALAELLGDPAAADQLWLPQAAPQDAGVDALPEAGAGAPKLRASDAPRLRVDRFKSPELLLLSDWPPDVAAPDLALTSRRLLETYGALLGRALACAHAAPLVAPEAGRFRQRWPRLTSAEAVLTYAQCAFDPATAEPFSRVFEDVGRALCAGLSAAWPETRLSLVSDPAAAKAAREPPFDPRHPIEAVVDFGGLTLQVTVRLPSTEGRAAPFLPGTSSSYLLGGERLIDAAALASADAAAFARADAAASASADAGARTLRETYRTAARHLRGVIGNRGRLNNGAAAVGEAILDTALSLVRRQLAGTLRRAAPHVLSGAGVRLYLLGESWKLIALDVPDEVREEETLRRLTARVLQQPLLEGVPVRLERMSKRRLCEGALRVPRGPPAPEEPVELQGVDAAESGSLRQRWFGIAGGDPLPGLAPSPSDPWWQTFSGGADSLLRVEQWFRAQGSPFRSRLSAGKLSFDPRRPLLKQWLDVSGPSLVALRIRDALTEPLG